MKVGLYGRLFGEEFSPFIQQLHDRLHSEGIELWVFEPFHQYLSSKINLKESFHFFNTYEEIKDNLDFVFSIGGDGTFLDATTIVRDSEIPIMGVNTGRLGFLSSIGINEIDEAVHAIQKGDYQIDKRALLKLETKDDLFGKQSFGLNELTVHKSDSSSMVIIHAYINGEFLNSYWADGLIISTPTGSTAYSLSCGGPIILPGSGNLVINPVAPHNLNVRPFVVPDESEITLRVSGRSDTYLVSLDSRSVTIDDSVELKVTKNSFHINLLHLEQQSYLNTIRNKLNWGIDNRN